MISIPVLQSLTLTRCPFVPNPGPLVALTTLVRLDINHFSVKLNMGPLPNCTTLPNLSLNDAKRDLGVAFTKSSMHDKWPIVGATHTEAWPVLTPLQLETFNIRALGLCTTLTNLSQAGRNAI